MSKQNMDLLNSMGLDERLDYAEKLVFGIEGLEQDLSAGMHVIKTEANNGNPKAEFLMYKVNISKGKDVAAMNWLRSSYNKGYGEALAMAFFEYDRGRLRGFKEKELILSLERAAQMNIPVANYFMGLLAENNNKNQEAKNYFAFAAEQGFNESYLTFTGCEEEYQQMNMLDFRGIFQRQWLPELFLNNIDLHIDAINKEEVNEQIEYIWNGMVESAGRNPADYPLEFEVGTYICKDNKTCYSIIKMPELPKARGANLAIYAMVVFDAKNKRKPRFFLGETDYNSLDRYIFTVEYICKNRQYMRQNLGPLACVEGRLRPVKKEEELDVFIENILGIYISEENPLKSAIYKVSEKFKKKR